MPFDLWNLSVPTVAIDDFVKGGIGRSRGSRSTRPLFFDTGWNWNPADYRPLP